MFVERHWKANWGWRCWRRLSRDACIDSRVYHVLLPGPCFARCQRMTHSILVSARYCRELCSPKNRRRRGTTKSPFGPDRFATGHAVQIGRSRIKDITLYENIIMGLYDPPLIRLIRH